MGLSAGVQPRLPDFRALRRPPPRVSAAAMERIAAILVIFVLLMNGRHVERRLPQQPTPITVSAEPLTVDWTPEARAQIGPLTWLGGWELTGQGGKDFGGLSSMHIDVDGNLVGVSDTGDVTTFRPGVATGTAEQHALPAFNYEAHAPRWRWDTESTTSDPQTGKYWVGFELMNRICRYGPHFAWVERCAHPDAMRNWPKSTGIESLTRLPDGRFLAIAEESPGPHGGHDVLIFDGDPVSAATPPPMRLGYEAPEGYLPTDALAIDHGRMLVLNRRVTVADGFTGVIVLVDISRAAPGAMLKGEVVAHLSGPIPHDNYEALAMSREGGRPILWVASDDNHMFFQRTLLLKFAMPDAWFLPRNAPNTGVPAAAP